MGFNKLAGDQLTAAELNTFYASAGLYAASSTGNDSYAITVSPVPNDYDAGDTYTFKADVANTGAATLNVNSLGVKTIKKFGTFDLETGDVAAGQIVTVKYDGTYFQLISVGKTTPFFQHAISGPTQGAAQGSASGSSSDGSVLYVAHRNATTPLKRYARDAVTGVYILTHEVAITSAIPSGDSGSIIELGSYIYLFSNDGVNIKCYRYLASNLTGETLMTVPTVAATTAVTAWTDGTYAYVVSGASSTTSRKWSVSGTTWSAVSTATVTVGIFAGNGSSEFWATMYDGTYAYVLKASISATITISIYKVTTIDGTVFTTTTKLIFQFSDADFGSFVVNIDPTKIYIGLCSVYYDETAVISSFINLIPVSKP